MKTSGPDRATPASARECVPRWSVVLGAQACVGLVALLVALLAAPRPALAAATLTLINGGGTLVVANWLGSVGDLDNVTVSYNGTDTYTITNTAAIINVAGSAPGRLNVSGSGTNTVTLTRIGSPTVAFTFDDGGAGNSYTVQNATVTTDSFAISNTSGAAGSDTITIVSTLTTSRFFSISDINVTTNGSRVTPGYAGTTTATLSIQGGSGVDEFVLAEAPTGITSIALQGGGSTDIFSVSTMPAGVSVAFDGEGGDNFVRLGNGSLAGITALPVCTSTGGTTGLEVDGSTEAAPKSITVTDTVVTGLAPIPILFNATSLRGIFLKAGNGGNTFDVNYTQGETASLQLESGSGNDTFTLADGANLGSGDIDGGGGTNTLDYSAWTTDILYAQFTPSAAGSTGLSFAVNIQIVNGGSGNDIFLIAAGTFTVNGNGGAFNQAFVNGTSAAETYTISASGASTLISRTSATPFTVTLTNVPIMSLLTEGGNDTVTVASTVAVGLGGVQVDGGDGDDAFIAGASGSTKGLLGDVGFDGKAGANTLTVDDSATATPDVVTVTSTSVGGGSSDTLFPPGVSVGVQNVTTLNLLTGTAADSVTVTPAANTAFVLNGGAPSSTPGDSIDFNLTGVTNPSFTGTVANGRLTSGNRQSVTFTNFETPRASGAPLTGTVQFSTSTYTVAEMAGPATIAVTRTFSTLGAGSVRLTPSNGTATAGSDFDATAITISFADGDNGGTASIPITADTLDEANETVNLVLSDATGVVTVGTPSTATLTITDDDVAESVLSIGNATVTEGNGGTTNAIFTVTLAPASASTVTVVAQTANGTATAGSDYTAVGPLTLTFTPGTTTQTVTVPITGDTTVEPDEDFLVNLSSPSGATIADGQGRGLILNDDSETPPVKTSDDDDDDKPKETAEQRQQRERTNNSNRDDYYTEGDVLEIHLDAEPPYIVIGMRDGPQRVNLLCGDQCPRVRVGDYVEVEGEKQNEALFDALELTVKRRR